MRISDWSSDVCSSDLALGAGGDLAGGHHDHAAGAQDPQQLRDRRAGRGQVRKYVDQDDHVEGVVGEGAVLDGYAVDDGAGDLRSEERRVGKEVVSMCCTRGWG